MPCPGDLALKDNLLVAGQPCRAGARALEHYVAPFTATVVERAVAAGWTVAGRTHMDAFGMGNSGASCAYCRPVHPLDAGRVPGGSSAGAAVAVAGAVPAALASDTGGSVLQPAALCGLVGVRPTWGTVSRWGLVAFASSMDTVGMLARDVGTARRLLHDVRGADGLDSRCVVAPAPEGSPTLAVAWRDQVDGPVRTALEQVPTTRCVELPDPSELVSAYFVLSSVEATSTLARFDGRRYPGRVANGRDVGVGWRLALGTWAAMHPGVLDQARSTRARVRRVLARIFADLGEHGVIVAPIVDRPAWPHEPTVAGETSHQTPTVLYDRFAVLAGLAGCPAVSVPFGSVDGLPMGLQVVGAPGYDDTCLHAAAMLAPR